MIETGLVVLAFLFGVGTFFSPCAVALLPAYVGYFTGLGPGGDDTKRVPLIRLLASGSRFGLAASAGILIVFAVFATIIYLLRITIQIPSRLLAQILETGGIAIGIIVILLGVLVLLGRAPTWTPRVAAPTKRTVPAMMFFGGLYSFASLGCTLPLFFFVLLQAILAGPVGGSVLILAYAIGFAGFMFIATVLLTTVEEPARRTLRWIMPYVKPASGILLIAAGAFVVVYYLVLTPAI
jgi:cytochrome c-type biogenesis protein